MPGCAASSALEAKRIPCSVVRGDVLAEGLEGLCRVFVLFNFPALFASLLPGAGTDAILHSLDASSYKGLSFVVGMREGGTKLLKFVFWHK